MTLRFGSVVLGVDDMERALAFWMPALDYVQRDVGDDDPTWRVLVPANGPGPQVALMLSETPVQDEPRIHVDLYAGDRADQAAEVARLVALGAQQVDWQRYPEDPDFIVLADTEGNRFCVIETEHTTT